MTRIQAIFPLGTLIARLKTNSRSMNKLIREAIVSELRQVFKNAEAPIRNRIAPIFARAVLNTNIVQELLSKGPLRGHLGVEDSNDVSGVILELIQQVIVQSTVVRNIGGQIQGKLFVGMVYADYQDLINHPDASFISEGDFKIPWLAWLVDSSGQEAFTIEYGIKMGEGLGRTGQAIMIKNYPNAPWTLPVQYLGQPENNFITQALDMIEEQILTIMIEEIENQI